MQYLALVVFAVLVVLGMVRPRWALVLLLVMFANEVGLQASVGAFRSNQGLANIILAGVVGMATLIALSRQERPMVGFLTSSLGIVLLILGWSILSLGWSPADSSIDNRGFNIITEGFPNYLMFVLLGPLLVHSVADWRRVTMIMLVAGSAVALSIIASPEFTVRGGRIGINLEGTFRTSPLSIAQMGGMLAIFGALSAGGRASQLQTIIRFSAFLCGALLVLFSGTRGQAVFALVTIALFLPVSRRLKNLTSYLSIVIVGGVVAVATYYAFDFVMGQSDADRWQAGAIGTATAARSSSAIALLTEFVQSPINWFIGLGYNAFSEVGDFSDLVYVHNLYVEVLCELGLPVFMLLMLLFFRTGKASIALFKHYREHAAERSAVAILVAMVVYQALISMKEGNLWSSWNLFLFMLIVLRLETRLRVLGDGSAYEDSPVDEEMSAEAVDQGIDDRRPPEGVQPA